MTNAFGGPVQLYSEVAESTPQQDMDLVRQTLARLDESRIGMLRLYRPRPTAAFSLRDTVMPRYDEAAVVMRTLGFEPVERRAGGQLAVYDENALVIDLVAPHDKPRIQIHERFKFFSSAIVSALSTMSIDARIGALSGEYCPGDYSVNGEGRIKLVGLAQRVVKSGYHLGAVISVTSSDRAKAAIEAAYDILGIAFDPNTFGALADLAPAMIRGKIHQTIQISVLNVIGRKQARASSS